MQNWVHKFVSILLGTEIAGFQYSSIKERKIEDDYNRKPYASGVDMIPYNKIQMYANICVKMSHSQVLLHVI